VKTTPSSEQRVAVITALAANVAVAIAKFAAAAVTGSSALIAESLHSLADSVNEVLLLVGARRSRRPTYGIPSDTRATATCTPSWCR
jgi:divalent metal cation (Fe/Co/Zn/Cd) transporter